MAALMTLDYGNTDKLAIFKQECQRMEIPVLPPNINESGVMFEVRDGSILYALAALKGVGHGAMEKIVGERNSNGKFRDFKDFINRLDAKVMNKKSFEQLICAGAFDTLYPKRAELHENMEALLRHVQTQAEERESGQVSLFGDAGSGNAELPPMKDVQEWDPLEKLRYEFDAVGFYLSAHPLDTKVAQLEKMKIVPFSRLADELDRKPTNRVQMAGILIKKVEKVSAKSGNKFAFLQMSDATGVYEVMIFSETLSRSRSFLEPGTALLLTVDADTKDEQIRLLGQIINPLDETLAEKLSELAVHIDAAAPAAKIKELISVEGQGNVKVTVYAYMDGGEVAELKVKGRWSMSPAAINAIRATPGVIRIAER